MTSESAALSQLVGDIYDAALAPERWRDALARTCAFVGGSSAVLFWHDAASERSAALHLWNEDPHYTRLYFEKYVRINPVFPAAAFLETGAVHSATDIIPQSELMKTRFYREWLRPQRMTDALAAVLEKGLTRAAFLNIRWVEDDVPMDEDSRRRLGLVVPHFQRAVSIGRLFDQSKATEEALSETLDHVEAAVFLVGANGRIVFANDAGQMMLDDGAILRERRQMLVATASDADRALRDIFRRASNGDASLGIRGLAVALSPSTSDQWFGHVLPLTSGRRQLAGSTYAAVAAVFVRKATREKASPLEVIARQYKLTATEVRVLDAVMQVNGVQAIAEALGISQATVKTHLRHLYQKSGTSRQSALVKLVAGFEQPSPH